MTQWLFECVCAGEPERIQHTLKAEVLMKQDGCRDIIQEPTVKGDGQAVGEAEPY